MPKTHASQKVPQPRPAPVAAMQWRLAELARQDPRKARLIDRLVKYFLDQ